MSVPTAPELEWIALGNFDHMEDEDVEGIRIHDHLYAVYRCNGALYVTDGRCTHKGAPLFKGIVIGDVIECPLHQGRFHIPSGRIVGGPVCQNLRAYPTKISDSILYAGRSSPKQSQ